MGNRSTQLPISQEEERAIALGMPPCPICESQNVRASHSTGFRDTLLALARYTPFRCRVCQHRFYKRLLKPRPRATETVG